MVCFRSDCDTVSNSNLFFEGAASPTGSEDVLIKGIDLGVAPAIEVEFTAMAFLD